MSTISPRRGLLIYNFVNCGGHVLSVSPVLTSVDKVVYYLGLVLMVESY